MNAELADQLFLPLGTPVAALALLALFGIATWAGVHVLRRPAAPWGRALHFALRVAIGYMALIAVADAARRYFVFATGWPVWAILLIGAAGVETVLALSALERSLVSARVGAALAILRALLVLLLAAMLCQPIRVVNFGRRVERNVAILLDESASMRVKESGLTPGEKVRLAETLSVEEASRLHRFDAIQLRLKRLQQQFAGQADWLATVPGTPAEPVSRFNRMDRRIREIRDSLRKAQDLLAEQTNAVAAALSAPFLKPAVPERAVMGEIAARLSADVYAEVTNSLQVIAMMYEKKKGAATNAPPEKPIDGPVLVMNALRRASSALVDLEPKLVQAGEAVDQAFFESLPEKDRKKIDAAVLHPRCDLARDLLLHHRVTNFEKGSTEPNLYERLRDKYGVRLYTFNSETVPTDVKALAASYSGAATNLVAAGPAQRTDLAGAIEHAAKDISPDRLAGILLMSDGRHNGAGQVEPAARTLGLKQVPIHSVVFGGGRRPPKDAGIVFAEAPDTVYTNDRVYISADIKLDGMAGTNVLVSLYSGQELVATTRVTAAGEAFRRRVQLADVPRTNGIYQYRLAVQETPDEVTYSNNTYSLPVNVIDERMRLLLVDGRPRWEFRYLKNLFTGRDSSVALQYLLFHPDQLAGTPPPEKIPASAARPVDECEATVLPETIEEWMKFDVVILGDVAPEELGDDAVKAIRRFVNDRGGTLVVIAGPVAMPHAFVGRPLAELLPVNFETSARPVMAGPESRFRIKLTAEGLDNAVMRLAVDPAENDRAWSEVPEIYWRHAVKGAKEGATVLAYALPAQGPDYMQPKFAGEIPDEETQRKRLQFQRDNPLIAVQHMARGRVMFLAFDHTWRLRYRVGDTYHHKFWGQVLRWGMGDKLPYGTPFIRLGAERARWLNDTGVKVRARLMKRDYTPIDKAAVAVSVFDGERRVLRKALQYVQDSPGVYATDLGILPVGEYRMELESPEAEAVLKADNLATVKSWFTVTSVFPFELSELAADRGLLARLASLTGGKIVEPSQASQMTDEFGPPYVTVRERWQYDFWNAWWFLVLLVALAGAEWALRKKVSLP